MAVPFKLPRFYPILDTAVLAARGADVWMAAEALLESGIKILQYRHKDSWEQRHFDEAKKAARRCQELGVLFVLNDRADFARLLRVALHVGQNDFPPLAAREVLGDEIMGFSTHNREQLERGQKEPVEYLSLGPIFATTSKLRPDPVVGVDRLRALRKLTTKPVCAIGGIKLENARQALDAGADSVAVISGWLPEKIDRKPIRRQIEEWLLALE